MDAIWIDPERGIGIPNHLLPIHETGVNGRVCDVIPAGSEIDDVSRFQCRLARDPLSGRVFSLLRVVMRKIDCTTGSLVCGELRQPGAVKADRRRIRAVRGFAVQVTIAMSRPIVIAAIPAIRDACLRSSGIYDRLTAPLWQGPGPQSTMPLPHPPIRAISEDALESPAPRSSRHAPSDLRRKSEL